MDAIIIRDIVAHILFSIQYNLVAGTIAPYALKRPDLRPVMEKILNFDVSYDASNNAVLRNPLTNHLTVLALCSMRLTMAVMQRIWKPLRPCSPMAVLSSTVLRLEQQSKLKTQESRRNTILTLLDLCHHQCP